MAQSPSRPIVAVRRRVAWIFEDELMRRNAERWLSLFGDRLFRAEITTFRSVRSAVSWLAVDAPDQQGLHSDDTRLNGCAELRVASVGGRAGVSVGSSSMRGTRRSHGDVRYGRTGGRVDERHS